MALPMSWTSPSTVPMTTTPRVSDSPSGSAALQISMAASIAAAASMSSGRYTSPSSNWSPTLRMPTTKPFCMMSCGLTPAAMARLATSSAASLSWLTRESIASL